MDECVFCRIVSGDEAASFVLRTEDVFALVDPRQFHAGHVLVIPNQHVHDVTELPTDLEGPLMSAVATIARAVKSVFQPDGMSVWHSIGEGAGQEVPHLHIHVHPRTVDDGMLRVYPSRPDRPTRAELDATAERIRAVLGPAGPGIG